ncbi:alkaline phosphatase D family protein [Zobellia roscoffensis]|uniref:alkaline phosphatase D family protein n=1 Tax=Zobellia roscoffensis TaxID=2779508 RepID=UPI00188CE8F0|nr:alkaline phosphatase D family protein [Zobellia roscoffensis]
MKFKLLHLLIIVGIISNSSCSEDKQKSSNNDFPYGVASGNPDSNGVLIWTKTLPKNVSQEILWQMSTDSLFSIIEKQGVESAKKQSDYTIKAQVDELHPGQTYYYRFTIGNNHSMVGRTKTLPAKNETPEKFKIALINCNNYQDGYFNAFNALSKRDDIDLVIHLGDYIYEYEAGRYADATLVDRQHKPSNEIVTLNDYRTRYAQYRSEKDFQKVHAKFPFLFIWDDHEFANDAYMTGAKNHNEGEGSWQQRQSNAIQAYMEWLPISYSPQKSPPTQLQIGQLIDLVLLEERASGRTKQIDPCELDKNPSVAHNILGKKQMETLVRAITTSTKPWTVIANQVAFTGYAKTDSLFSLKYQDWWLGYPDDRKQIIGALKKASSKPIILTGDHHRSFVMAVHDDSLNACNPKYVSGYKEKPLAWEIMVPSISSKNHDVYPNSVVSAYSKKLLNQRHNPHIKFADLNQHGFTVMHFTSDKVSAEYVFMKTVKKRDSTIKTVKKIELNF